MRKAQKLDEKKKNITFERCKKLLKSAALKNPDKILFTDEKLLPLNDRLITKMTSYGQKNVLMKKQSFPGFCYVWHGEKLPPRPKRHWFLLKRGVKYLLRLSPTSREYSTPPGSFYIQKWKLNLSTRFSAVSPSKINATVDKSQFLEFYHVSRTTSLLSSPWTFPYGASWSRRFVRHRIIII